MFNANLCTFYDYDQFKATHMYSGAMIFDLESSSLSNVAEKMVDELLRKNEIRASDREGLLRALNMSRRSPTKPSICPLLSTR